MEQIRQLILLVGMVVVLELELRKKFGDGDGSNGRSKSDELIKALSLSCKCWEAVKKVSDKALAAGTMIIRMAKELGAWNKKEEELSLEVDGSTPSFDMDGMEFDWVRLHRQLRNFPRRDADSHRTPGTHLSTRLHFRADQ
jgi:hypothetical protein